MSKSVFVWLEPISSPASLPWPSLPSLTSPAADSAPRMTRMIFLIDNWPNVTSPWRSHRQIEIMQRERCIVVDRSINQNNKFCHGCICCCMFDPGVFNQHSGRGWMAFAQKTKVPISYGLGWKIFFQTLWPGSCLQWWRSFCWLSWILSWISSISKSLPRSLLFVCPENIKQTIIIIIITWSRDPFHLTLGCGYYSNIGPPPSQKNATNAKY